MKKVLLLGSSSFTGHCLVKHLGTDFSITTVNRGGREADIKFDAETDDIKAIESAVAQSDAVINCISNGDVDSCEQNPATAKVLNHDFVLKLCDLQKRYNFHLIHFSSNAVYDGNKAPYSEQSPANAINRYGQMKLMTDQFIENNLVCYTVLRPITMYGLKLGAQRHNPFSFFYEQLLQNRDIIAVDDVFVNMLHVEDLAECVRNALTDQVYGTYNISGDDVVNRYEFVTMIKRLIPGCKSSVKAVTSDQFKTIAQRPKNTSFDNTKMKEMLGVYPQSLEATLSGLVKRCSDQLVERTLKAA